MREVARQNLEKARKNRGNVTKKEFRHGAHSRQGKQQYTYADRKDGNWGAKWIGPFEIVCRMGVDYKIRSTKGKITDCCVVILPEETQLSLQFLWARILLLRDGVT